MTWRNFDSSEFIAENRSKTEIIDRHCEILNFASISLGIEKKPFFNVEIGSHAIAIGINPA